MERSIFISYDQVKNFPAGWEQTTLFNGMVLNIRGCHLLDDKAIKDALEHDGEVEFINTGSMPNFIAMTRA